MRRKLQSVSDRFALSNPCYPRHPWPYFSLEIKQHRAYFVVLTLIFCELLTVTTIVVSRYARSVISFWLLVLSTKRPDSASNKISLLCSCDLMRVFASAAVTSVVFPAIFNSC